MQTEVTQHGIGSERRIDADRPDCPAALTNRVPYITSAGGSTECAQRGSQVERLITPRQTDSWSSWSFWSAAEIARRLNDRRTMTSAWSSRNLDSYLA